MANEVQGASALVAVSAQRAALTQSARQVDKQQRLFNNFEDAVSSPQAFASPVSSPGSSMRFTSSVGLSPPNRPNRTNRTAPLSSSEAVARASAKELNAARERARRLVAAAEAKLAKARAGRREQRKRKLAQMKSDAAREAQVAEAKDRAEIERNHREAITQAQQAAQQATEKAVRKRKEAAEKGEKIICRKERKKKKTYLAALHLFVFVPLDFLLTHAVCPPPPTIPLFFIVAFSFFFRNCLSKKQQQD